MPSPNHALGCLRSAYWTAVPLRGEPEKEAWVRGMLLSRQIFALIFALAFASPGAGQEVVTVPRQDHQPVNFTAYETDNATCRGVAVISPGAGGSEKGYSYLGEELSAEGYLAVVVGHKESGFDEVRQRMRGNGLREGLSQLITDPAAYKARFMDIAAATRWARERCDSSVSVLLGHSMGAATVMIEAGAKNNLGLAGSDNFDAYIALSPQGSGSIFPADAWKEIAKPVLMLTGTRDSRLSGGSWETRLEPFHNMAPGCKWAGVVDGASHMNFAGRGRSRRAESLTLEMIDAFLQSLQENECGHPPRKRGMQVQAK